jgi:hypothetical protein
MAKSDLTIAREAAAAALREENLYFWGLMLTIPVYAVALHFTRGKKYGELVTAIMGIMFSFFGVGLMRAWDDRRKAQIAERNAMLTNNLIA